MSQFHIDLEFEKNKDKVLKTFYDRICGKNNWFKVGMKLQNKGIDIVDIKTKETYENKVRRKKWDDFALETKSCTVRGYEKDGWMKYSCANWLIYGFDLVTSIELYQIDFRKLRAWFWNDDNFLNYSTIITSQINRTESRIVPIEDVAQFIKNRFRLTVRKKIASEREKPYKEIIPPMSKEKKDEIIEMVKRVFDVDLSYNNF